MKLRPFVTGSALAAVAIGTVPLPASVALTTASVWSHRRLLPPTASFVASSARPGENGEDGSSGTPAFNPCRPWRQQRRHGSSVSPSLLVRYAAPKDDGAANNGGNGRGNRKNTDNKKRAGTRPKRRRRSPSKQSKDERQKEKQELMKSVQAKMKEARSLSSPSSSTSTSSVKSDQRRQKELRRRQDPSQFETPVGQDSGGSDDSDSRSEQNKSNANSILSSLNPFQAGQNLRKTLDSLTTNLGGLSEETKKKYYLDDRLTSSGESLLSSFSAQRDGSLEKLLERDDYIPEVLVVGATGMVGRSVVRRLLLEGRFRVRVLVRDLYSETLNLFGTGVTYCQGDLSNIESLEYALTDVDKIVFCAGAPKPDELDFKKNFRSFVDENLDKDGHGSAAGEHGSNRDRTETDMSDTEWEKLDHILELRSQLAEQVDLVGMGNLVRAYQNVRHADYGTSQAAKRSLFKFSSRHEDFTLFSLDDSDDDRTVNIDSKSANSPNSVSAIHGYRGGNYKRSDDAYDDEYYNEYDEYGDYQYSDEYEYAEYDDDGRQRIENVVATRRDATSQTQCRWLRNDQGSGVFVGWVPKSAAGTSIQGVAAIISSRLRARDDPENGIDLGTSFAGFIVRAISDGSNFEAFVRTSIYETDGVEYVCPFATQSKPLRNGNKSRYRAVSIRLPFADFVPVLKRAREKGRSSTGALDPEDGDFRGGDTVVAAPFDGSDVRYLGFRYRSADNEYQPGARKERGLINFYFAMRYIKVYRQQPEPEFVYLSDARIPKNITSSMVRHDLRQIVTMNDVGNANGGLLSQPASAAREAVELFSENMLAGANKGAERSKAETYFKFRGEEILKNSGLSYTIIRVAGFNELMSGEASTIDLNTAGDKDIVPVSRDEAAQVCVGALMDPNALNKSVYMGKHLTKQKRTAADESIKAKFAALSRK